MSVVGKLFLLSGKDSFIISNYPENLNELLTKSKQNLNLYINF